MGSRKGECFPDADTAIVNAYRYPNLAENVCARIVSEVASSRPRRADNPITALLFS